MNSLSFIVRYIVFLSLAVFLSIAEAIASPVLSTSKMSIVFSDDGNIVSITPQFTTTKKTTVQTTFIAPDKQSLFAVESLVSGEQCSFSTFWECNDSITGIRFKRSDKEMTYRISMSDYSIEITIQSPGTLPAPHRLHITPATLKKVAITGKRSFYLKNSLDSSKLRSRTVRWIGFRDHFWALLAEGKNIGLLPSDEAVSFLSVRDSAAFIRLYAGPIEYSELRKIDPSCTHLLYPIWQWMRVLSLGLLVIFNTLLALTNNSVLSIILLSVAVKIILAPLYRFARRWQCEVNRQKSILEPRINAIKKECKGEEQNIRILALHKELGISPLYTLKSLLSAGIQIPVFFAAYHMLSEHIALLHIPFLWIDDLSQPDRSIHLPFDVFLIGNHINMLPFLMTAITIASSYVHTDRSLSTALHAKQQQSLYIMAALFFVLLYASPAGMLLYWTMNNVLSFITSLGSFIVVRKKSAPSPESNTV